MKYFCCECGRPVPQKLHGGNWTVGRCGLHPAAKRYSESFARGWFRRMGDVCGGELAAQIAALRDCRRPYLPPALSELLRGVKGGAS